MNHQISEEAEGDSHRQGDARESPGALYCSGAYGEEDPSHHPQDDIGEPLGAVRGEPQPLEAVIEQATKEQHVGEEAHPSRHGQSVEGLIVRAVWRRVASLIVGQVGRIETVIGHEHGLRAVADQRAYYVQAIQLIGRQTYGLMGTDQVDDPLPNQDPHLPSAGLRLEDFPQPSHVGKSPQGSQGAARHVQHGQEQDPGQGRTCRRHPQPGEAAPHPEDEHEDEQSHQQPYPGAAALGEEDADQLNGEDEAVQYP